MSPHLRTLVAVYLTTLILLAALWVWEYPRVKSCCGASECTIMHRWDAPPNEDWEW